MKDKIKSAALIFLLITLIWVQLDYIPQMLSASDTIANILGIGAIICSILIDKYIISIIKQTNKKTTS